MYSVKYETYCSTITIVTQLYLQSLLNYKHILASRDQ